MVFVLEVPDEVPEEDIRSALYKFQSVVEVQRLPCPGGVITSASATSLSSAGGQQTSGQFLVLRVCYKCALLYTAGDQQTSGQFLVPRVC